MSVASRTMAWGRRMRAPAGPWAGPALIRWDGTGLAGGTPVDTTTRGPEDRAFDTVTAATFTITATGARSPRIQMDQQAATAAQLIWAGLPSSSAYAVRMYLQISAYPSAGAPVLQAYRSSVLRWRVDVTSAGLLRLRDAGNTVVATAAAAVTTGVELRLEVTVDDTTATVTAYTGDTVTALVTLTGTVGDDVDELRFGNTQSAPTWPTLYLDAIAFRPGTDPIGPPAAVYVDPGVTAQPGRRVEMHIAGQWVDITSDVYYRDMIEISRGRSDWASQPDPATCKFTLNNRSGKYSPRNPLSPYYGQLGRNTPIRVSRVQGDIVRARCTGEVSSWPVGWDPSGADVYVQIEAAGITRRLGQGGAAVRSALYRTITTGITTGAFTVYGYWPLEDGEGAKTIASGLSPGIPMSRYGNPTFTSDGPVGAAGSVNFERGGRIMGRLNTMPADPEGWTVSYWIDVPYQDAADPLAAVDWSCPSQVIYQRYLAIPGFTGTSTPLGRLQIVVFPDSPGAAGVNTIISTTDLRGLGPTHVAVQATQDGATLYLWLYINGTLEGSATISDFVGPVTSIRASNGLGFGAGIASSNTPAYGNISHISVHAVDDVDNVIASIRDAGTGYDGERAGDRIARLCREEGISHARYQPAGDTVPMGPQRVDTLANLLREAADADQGILYEPRDQLGIAYRDRASLYNQTTRLALDYAAGELADVPTPVDDDQSIVNDVTAEQPSGSSYRAVLEDGPLSVQAAPDGVGRYDQAYPINAAEGWLGPVAGWLLHQGTVDEARVPALTVNLRHAPFAEDDAAMGAVLALELGDRVVVENPPAWLPPEALSQVAQGYTETIGAREHDLVFQCTPAAGYEVAVRDSDRRDTAGSVLAADAAAGATTLSVSTTVGPLWTTAAGEVPFDVWLGGEQITVTGISGASSPQTFTVTRAVNGIQKAQAAGTAMRLWRTPYRAL